MDLTRLQTDTGPRWSMDGFFLMQDFSLCHLLARPLQHHSAFLHNQLTTESAFGQPLAPIEPEQEVWASGVTYLRSREAREAESATGDIYQYIYSALRPELFFKSNGWRVIGPHGTIHVRSDSHWNVPEPELTLIITAYGEVCGFTAGNDVSSRDIEGENPLYLPQAKVYNGSCALGPSISLVENVRDLTNIAIHLEIFRAGNSIFEGETNTGLMKRSFDELTSFLFKELNFPHGVFLLSGTGIVPPEAYSLVPGDNVWIKVGGILLKNTTG